jgi:hypothetical protein
MAFAVRQLETEGRESGVRALCATPLAKTPRVSGHVQQSGVFVTATTEYEVRDGICCAVRDRATSARRVNHRAIGMRLARTSDRGQILHLVGDSFAVLMTSLVEEVRSVGGKRRQRTSGTQLRIAASR